jgi:hypothetical protein
MRRLPLTKNKKKSKDCCGKPKKKRCKSCPFRK